MNFIKYRRVYFLISIIFILSSFVFLASWGLKLSVDFKGGSLWEIESAEETDVVQEYFKSQEVVNEVQKTGENGLIIRMDQIDNAKKDEIETLAKESIGEFSELRFESLQPSFGRGLLTKALVSVVVAVLAILIYVNFRFSDKSFGICAVLAMLHDSIILLGTFSLLGYLKGVEVDTLFVTAFLTTLSFSVHDTVVVYDQIREIMKNKGESNFDQVANLSIEQTIVRSINNSMTIIFVLLSLFLLGGETTKWFSFALLVGTIAGTYSSTFTAVPLLAVWNKRVKNK